ncbi:MAG: antibiotic biosynthesis monooxygenase [Ktedonobacteraceae bacterium]|nr:antibiotic biosynthesis monooxygenase [Ktedonobacteraceae bacterium]
MELLVATLVRTESGKDADALAGVRTVADTIRNVPGLVTAQLYRSGSPEHYYFFFTTWEDDETWRSVRERYNPRNLLTGTAASLLTSPPEQWFMRYLWGCHRPAATTALAAAHLYTVPADQAEFVQRGWLQGLHRQLSPLALSFAFIARGIREADLIETRPSLASSGGAEEEGQRISQGNVFLHLFNWTGEMEHENFYASSCYQALNALGRRAGTSHVYPLEPL